MSAPSVPGAPAAPDLTHSIAGEEDPGASLDLAPLHADAVAAPDADPSPVPNPLEAPGELPGPAERRSRSGGGDTHWTQVAHDGRDTGAPKQPNERDESSSSQTSASGSHGGIGRVAYADAVGQTDTDKAPVMDAVYNREVVEGEDRRGALRGPDHDRGDPDHLP